MTAYTQDNAATPGLVRRLVREYLRPHFRKLAAAVACMLLVAGATAANAWMMQPVLDEIFVKRDTTMLTLLPLALIVLALLKGAGAYGQMVLMSYVGQRVVSDMQHRLYCHLIDSDMALFNAQSSGSLISRFTNDITLLRESASSVLTTLAKEMITLIFLVGVMFYQSVPLSLIALVGFPLAIYPLVRLGKRMRKISHATQHDLGGLTAHLDESFQGIRIIKAYGREAQEKARSKSHIEGVFAHYVKAFRVKSAASPLMETLGALAIAAVIWYGGGQVLTGETTPGAFFSFMAALLMAYKPMKSMAGLNTRLQEGLAAAHRVFAVLDTPPSITDAANAAPLLVKDGAISFDKVGFAYSDQIVLDDISLQVPPGKMVALVGPSGSGKSTITNLLLRFYEAQQGSIRIDGQDIRQVTQESLRASMALVTQETILFDDTVRANICYGRRDISEAEMLAAAKDAEAHDFITQLPKGYDTVIGQHGLRLSGGQRQRLAIARAMLKDAPILLLDEATSALDPIAEKKIQGALARLMQGRTALVIAHRLSTIMDADIIYVLQDGRIAESGDHATLLDKGGIYATLYSQQD